MNFLQNFYKYQLSYFSFILFVIILLSINIIAMMHSNAHSTIYYGQGLIKPHLNKGFILGTDLAGRDLFLKITYSINMSLFVAISASTIATFIGVVYGLIAGMSSPAMNSLMNKICEFFMIIPGFFILLLLSSIYGHSILTIIIFIGMTEWIYTAVMIRNHVTMLSTSGFIKAAQCMGLSKMQIIINHICPYIYSITIIQWFSKIPLIINIESTLSFLGLGVQEPVSTLGKLIQEGSDLYYVAPWLLLYPLSMLIILMVIVGFIVDGIQRALTSQNSGLI